MKFVILILALTIFVSTQVIAVQNPALYIGSQQVEYVPNNEDPAPRDVNLVFAVESPFTSGYVDASDLAVRGTIRREQDRIMINDCQENGAVIICNVTGLKLQTGNEDAELKFYLTRNGVEQIESASISFDKDTQPPTVSGIELNECTDECYFGTGQNDVIVRIADNIGINPGDVPILVGRNVRYPISCDDTKCFYSFPSISCVDGSTVTVTVPTSVSDVTGNTLQRAYTKDFICDPASPVILEEPRIIDRGPLDHLYEGVRVQFKAIVEDSTPVTMFVDFRHMDGVLEEIECRPGAVSREQICQGEVYSPPGPQTGEAKITFLDSSGNSIDRTVEVEIYALNTDATPEVEIRRVTHTGSISRMLLAAANERDDIEINYPIIFDIEPRLIADGARLRAQIAHIEVTDCLGGVVEDFNFITENTEKNRVDVKLNANYLDSGNPAIINCTTKVWVKSGDRFFETPAVASVIAEIELRGTDFLTPGQKVVQLLEERDSNTQAFSVVEAVNNFVPTLNTMCNVANAIDQGEIIGASVQIVGFASSPVGEPIKRLGQQVSDKLLQISGVLGSYYNDKRLTEAQIDEQARNELNELNPSQQINDAARTARSPQTLLQRGGGFLKKACTYIQCSEADPERKTIGQAQDLSGVFNGALDQLTAPNARDNIIYAIEQKCIPAIIGNLNDYGQAYCGATLCMKNMAYSGGDLSSCEQIQAEAMCKKVVGTVTEGVAYLASTQDGTLGTIGDIGLGLKNLRERGADVAMNAAIGAINVGLIQRVTGNCQRVEKNAPDDHKSLTCFIPRAARLFIQSKEQQQLFRETTGSLSNLCEIAACEGNECEDQLLSRDELSHWNIVMPDNDYSDNEFEPHTDQTNDLVPVTLNGEPVNWGENRFYANADHWEALNDAQRNRIASAANEYNPQEFEGFPNREFRSNYPYVSRPITPEELETYSFQAGIYDEINTHGRSGLDGSGLVYPSGYPAAQGPANLDESIREANYVALPEGVSPNLAPLSAVDNNLFSSDFEEGGLSRNDFMTDQDGNIIAWDNEEGEWKQVYSPNNPGMAYDIYRQVAAPFVNQLFDDYVVSRYREDVQGWINAFDDNIGYSKLENSICEIAWDIPPVDQRPVFEATDTGFIQFDFNAEKWYNEEDDQWYYTLIFFMSGFDDQSDGLDDDGNYDSNEGYDVEIFLQNPNVLTLRRFEIFAGETFRPDASGVFKSIRAFNFDEEYRSICFRFSPEIPSRTDVFCKDFRLNAWSGLGDPYVPGTQISRGRDTSGGDRSWLH